VAFIQSSQYMVTLSVPVAYTKLVAVKGHLPMSKRRIGIYAGTFDPVHTGHISFALQALKTAKLDLVIFMPERRPRYKPNVEHFGHRTAMITRAIQPHTKLALLELPDAHFNTLKTLPKLHKKFPDAQLVLLMGSDVAYTLKDWPDIDKLLSQSELVVGLRDGQSPGSALQSLNNLKPTPKVTMIKSLEPSASSGKIRKALRKNIPAIGLLASVRRYARSHWLYASLDGS
jgi:nicotinate-nucleotide adenylyltransferase